MLILKVNGKIGRIENLTSTVDGEKRIRFTSVGEVTRSQSLF